MYDLVGTMLLTAFAGLHLAPAAAIPLYFKRERELRGHWQAIALPAHPVESSAYRSGGAVVTAHLERAPAVVRWAAASCFVFGAMFLPGAAWAVVGLFAGGVGVTSIPGLVIAALLWSAGTAVLRGDRAAYFEGLRAAKASAALNVLILGLATAAAVLSKDEGFVKLALFTGAYAVASLAQAALLAKAALRIGELRAEPSPDEVAERPLPPHLAQLLERKRARAT